MYDIKVTETGQFVVKVQNVYITFPTDLTAGQIREILWSIQVDSSDYVTFGDLKAGDDE